MGAAEKRKASWRRGALFGLAGGLAGFLLITVIKLWTGDSPPQFRSFLGKRPPELPAGGTWINSVPLTLAALQGKPAFLQFTFVG
jgi:hypothetical protein